MTDDSKALVTSASAQLERELTSNLKRIQSLIPSHSEEDAKRACAIVMKATTRNPDLLTCDRFSIVDAVMQGVELGLDVGGILGEAWLIPFREKGVKKCKCIIGYQGLLKLAYQHPRVLAVKAVIVREGDPFEYIEGSKPEVMHRPVVGSTRDVIAAYCRWQLLGGVTECDVMSRAELDEQKAESLSKLQDWSRKQSPWTVHEPEMQKKTVLRRSAKYAPRSSAFDRALELETLREKQERGE